MNSRRNTNKLYVFYATVEHSIPLEFFEGRLSIFSPSEREQYYRFRFDPDRCVYAVAHLLLRWTLEQHTGIAAHLLRFVAGENGKPRLDDPQPSQPIHFNLTHTRGLAACAVTGAGPVGIDAEYLDRDVGDEVAEHYFSESEVAYLKENPACRSEAFLDLWTLKEAVIKALGTGLTIPLSSFSVQLAPELDVAFEPAHHEDPGAWKLYRIKIPTPHRLAVAVKDPLGGDIEVWTECANRFLDLPVGEGEQGDCQATDLGS